MLRSVTLAFLLASAAAASAATTSYGVQADFEAALPNGFKLLNMDAAPYSTNASGYRLSSVAAALAADGVVSIGYNAQVLAGQDGQTPTNRDWLITNGLAFSGGQPSHIAFNFTAPVNGIGAFSNILGNGDGGRVRIFSGANLTGLLGEVAFGLGSGINGFGGIASTVAIGSAEFTCDFNNDLACGVYDIQFGRLAVAAIPEAPTWAMMIGGFGLLGAAVRRRASLSTVPS